MSKQILEKCSVLYVEDEKQIRDFTSNILSSLVEKLIIAENGQDGLEKFKNNDDINLIVTDINMPKLDGLSMCRKLREIKKDIPIIITSGHNDDTYIKQAGELCVAQYINKPIDLSELIKAIIKIFDNK